MTERVRDLTGDEAFHQAVIGYLADKRFIERVNACLVHGDTRGAAAVVENEGARRGINDLIRRTGEEVRALAELARVCRGQPYTSSRRLAAALASLQPAGRLLDRSPAYRAWLKRRQRRLQRLRRQERLRALMKEAQACGRAMFGGEFAAGLQAFHRLAAAGREAPEEAWLVSRTRGKERFPEKRLRSALERLRRRKMPEYARIALAAALVYDWPELPAGMREQAGRVFAGLKKAGVSDACSLWLAAWGETMVGRGADGARDLRAACLAARPAPARFLELVPRLLMDREQFTARVWRTPFPTVPDLVCGLAQLAVQHRAEGGGAGRSRRKSNLSARRRVEP